MGHGGAPCNYSTQETKMENEEFKPCLGYMESSRPSQVSKKQKAKQHITMHSVMFKNSLSYSIILSRKNIVAMEVTDFINTLLKEK